MVTDEVSQDNPTGRLRDLQHLREALKEWMIDAPVDRKAALVAQFRAVLAEIDELAPPEKKGDIVDQVAERRNARRAAAAKNKNRSTG